MRHRLLRFVAAALFFAAAGWVSSGLRTTGGPDEVESHCLTGGGGGVDMEVCTPWS